MNGRPGTKAECDALLTGANLALAAGADDVARALRSLHEKLTAPFRPRPALPDVRAIEAALGGPAVNGLEAWYVGQARKAAAVGATVEDARVIGPWLRAQRWGKDMTVDRVLAGWPSYLARARAAGKVDGEDWARREFGGVADRPGGGA